MPPPEVLAAEADDVEAVAAGAEDEADDIACGERAIESEGALLDDGRSFSFSDSELLQASGKIDSAPRRDERLEIPC